MLSCLVNASHNHSATNYFKNNSKIPNRERIYRAASKARRDLWTNLFSFFIQNQPKEWQVDSAHFIVKQFTLISIIACLRCSCHVFRRQNNVCATTKIPMKRWILCTKTMSSFRTQTKRCISHISKPQLSNFHWKFEWINSSPSPSIERTVFWNVLWSLTL